MCIRDSLCPFPGGDSLLKATTNPAVQQIMVLVTYHGMSLLIPCYTSGSVHRPNPVWYDLTAGARNQQQQEQPTAHKHKHTQHNISEKKNDHYEEIVLGRDATNNDGVGRTIMDHHPIMRRLPYIADFADGPIAHTESSRSRVVVVVVVPLSRSFQ